jgi:hypothetical protein
LESALVNEFLIFENFWETGMSMKCLWNK